MALFGLLNNGSCLTNRPPPNDLCHLCFASCRRSPSQALLPFESPFLCTVQPVSTASSVSAGAGLGREAAAPLAAQR